MTTTTAETLPTVPLRTWPHYAACRSTNDPHLLPIVGGAPTDDELTHRRATAERYCARCPMIHSCGAVGDLHAEEGVWGGSLRYRTGGGPRGEYRVLRLISGAAVSIYDEEG